LHKNRHRTFWQPHLYLAVINQNRVVIRQPIDQLRPVLQTNHTNIKLELLGLSVVVKDDKNYRSFRDSRISVLLRKRKD
jgi:hypothetical protein